MLLRIGLYTPAMPKKNPKVVAAGMASTAELVVAIASRRWTAQELSRIFNRSVAELKEFVERNLERIEEAREVYEALESDATADIGDLWMSAKLERLRRAQNVAEVLYEGAIRTFDPVILREFRSYLAYAANELGQMMHRNSGENADGAVANYLIDGVDVSDLQ